MWSTFQPVVVGLSENPNPGSDGATTWNAGSDASSGSTSASRTSRNSTTEPGHPWVTISGCASLRGDRTCRKWMPRPSMTVRYWPRALSSSDSAATSWSSSQERHSSATRGGGNALGPVADRLGLRETHPTEAFVQVSDLLGRGCRARTAPRRGSRPEEAPRRRRHGATAASRDMTTTLDGRRTRCRTGHRMGCHPPTPSVGTRSPEGGNFSPRRHTGRHRGDERSGGDHRAERTARGAAGGSSGSGRVRRLRGPGLRPARRGRWTPTDPTRGSRPRSARRRLRRNFDEDDLPRRGRPR